jgi:hypothetical protein
MAEAQQQGVCQRASHKRAIFSGMKLIWAGNQANFAAPKLPGVE